jgi:hypothetical protein
MIGCFSEIFRPVKTIGNSDADFSPILSLHLTNIITDIARPLTELTKVCTLWPLSLAAIGTLVGAYYSKPQTE